MKLTSSMQRTHTYAYTKHTSLTWHHSLFIIKYNAVH